MYKRKLIRTYINSLNVDDPWERSYVDLNKWLKTLDSKTIFNDDLGKENPCKTTNTAIYVTPEQRTLPSICKKLSRKYCKKDTNDMILIDVPEKSNFYASNGMQLLPGESYCIYKPLTTQKHKKCNETWGFWKYSPVEEKWVCYSKVPGIYNAKIDKFDPCQREHENNQFLIDDKPVLPNEIPNKFSPEDFYSTQFQLRCKCRCDKNQGYIFNPKLSRTSCYKDPCLLELPPFAAANGLNIKTGDCECGQFFSNLFNNPKNPCTACPYDRPSYDPKKFELTVYIKCYNENEINTEKRFGIIPCQTPEDKIRGCTKAIIKVKHITNNNISFTDRIMW